MNVRYLHGSPLHEAISNGGSRTRACSDRDVYRKAVVNVVRRFAGDRGRETNLSTLHASLRITAALHTTAAKLVAGAVSR
jgi:hypothetical protein